MIAGRMFRALRGAGNSALWIAAISAFCLGSALSLSLAPWHVLWTLPLSLAGVGVLVVWAQTRVQGGLIGWLFGLGYFGFGLSWIIEPFQIDADRYAWMAPFALLFLAAGLALFWALAFAAAVRWASGGARLILLIALWSLAEFARSYLLTGFPWAGFGQFWINTPAAQLLPWIGPQGVAVLTLAAALPLALFRRHPVWAAGPFVLSVLGVFLLPAPGEPEMSDKLVRLVQPNAPQAEKWLPDRRWDFVRRAIELSEEAIPTAGGSTVSRRPDLILWPETSVPQLLNNAQDTLAAISDRVDGVPLVLGIQRREGERYFNSAILLDDVGETVQIYDKAHLVPFGEYVPFGNVMARFGIYGFASQAGAGYSAGPGAVLMELPLGKALPLICYEAVFPQDVNAVSERPDMLVQLTNDAWFGTRSGPYQHLVQARMRAAEQGLPMLRAANTGITAMIDPYGRIRESIPLGQAGAVDAVLPRPLDVTFYSRTGDWPVFLFCIVLAGFGRFLACRTTSRS